MRTFNINTLFGEQHPYVSLHDAPIEKIAVDYLKREVYISCALWVAIPEVEQSEQLQRGQITFTGLRYFVAQAPDENYCYDDPKGLDIVSHGSLSAEQMQQLYHNLPRDLEEDDFVYYFYATNSNSSIIVAANHARFEWLD